ncbi:YcgN family cysteine cluster protein [Marinobacter sp. SS21]|uniref:YcgN family cysteine cluster protein n=1 Tax=Marinobacter sp. SS21 TaxID=2979460 RepID=UPI00232B5AE8|nr:YcgN family cysteine cluster protein [Marinobacter sp. SS21]MDC0661922.1 YcgN family cysteine cluster protein [Marinobacter sp. SS21]
MIAAVPFWQRKRLEEMSPAEWESLCDGCGQCCLVKLEDEDTEEVYHTDLVCRYMDSDSCRCTVYSERLQKVPGCSVLGAGTVADYGWLPRTCAYRTLAEKRPLPDWHPLRSGDPDSVHEAGVSVRHRVISEADVPEEDWEEHIIHWVL